MGLPASRVRALKFSLDAMSPRHLLPPINLSRSRDNFTTILTSFSVQNVIFQNFWHKNFFCYCFFLWRPGGITSCCGKLRVPQSYAERLSFFCAAMQSLLLFLFGAIKMKTLTERHFLVVVWRSDSSQSWIHKTNIFAWYKMWFEFF